MMINKRIKIILFGIYFFFGIIVSYGQDMMWTTISGTNIRHIPLNNVKAEILRLSTQFSYFWLDVETPYRSRAQMREGTSRALENPAYRYQTQMFLSWIDNNQNFVYATRTQIRSLRIDSMSITIVNGDRVYILDFSTNNRTGKEYQTSNNREYIDNLLNSWLSGMVSQHSANPVAVNNFNVRAGNVTRSAPTVSSSDYDRVITINRFILLPSNWFTDTFVSAGLTENRARQVLTQIGFTNVEQNSIFNEVRRSGAIIFYYLDRDNYVSFLHVEIE